MKPEGIELNGSASIEKDARVGRKDSNDGESYIGEEWNYDKDHKSFGGK